MAVPALRTEKLDLPVSSSAKRRLEAAVAVSHRSVSALVLEIFRHAPEPVKKGWANIPFLSCCLHDWL